MKKIAFKFDDVSIVPDRQIGEHSHPQWELSYVIRGGGVRTIGDCTAAVSEGEIILIPPGIPHVWRFDSTRTDTEGNISNITVLFEPATLAALAVIIPEFNRVADKFNMWSDAMRLTGEMSSRVGSLLLSMRGLAPAARVPKMIELLLDIAAANNCIFAGHNNVLSRAERRLEKVRIYCECNYAREITLEEMAVYAGMNKSAFCTFMRRHTGMSFSKFVNNMRLEKAVDMLRHTDSIIADIAYDTGFANVTYFNRLFRAKYNCTPKSVREVMRRI